MASESYLAGLDLPVIIDIPLEERKGNGLDPVHRLLSSCGRDPEHNVIQSIIKVARFKSPLCQSKQGKGVRLKSEVCVS